jgi:hypothetical protein
MKVPVNFNILMRQINAVRAATHLDPLEKMPKGEVGVTNACPIARALSNGIRADVESHSIYLYSDNDNDIAWNEIATNLRRAGMKEVELSYDANGISFATTKTMENFIQRFDNDEFTDLIEGK